MHETQTPNTQVLDRQRVSAERRHCQADEKKSYHTTDGSSLDSLWSVGTEFSGQRLERVDESAL